MPNIIKHPCFDEIRRIEHGYRIVSAGLITQPIDDSTHYLPNTDCIMRDTFWIGVYPGMTEAMLEYMVDTIKAFVEG
jgi:CDP-6-deoxy-D-xylo-4-hexulose-3-dehydrase